jgi:sarcinarray family protein
MKFRIFIFLLAILILNFHASAEENEYGIVKAWFNAKNATTETVEGVQLKSGEQADVKVEVISKINGQVFIKLKEPGVTKAYDIISGPSQQDEYIDNYDVMSGWSKTYTWKLTPNGAWKNGNAPINIFVLFSKIENGKIKGDKTVQFTIANPYILDEQYSGAVPTPEKTVSPAETRAKETPFLPVIFAVSALIMAWRWRKGKK